MESEAYLENLRKRAQALQQFMAMVGDLPAEVRGPLPSIVNFPVVDSFQMALPVVQVHQRTLEWGARSLDLSRRPLMIQLFQSLIKRHPHGLDRDTMLAEVYAIDAMSSIRRRVSAMQNAVKLVSRARELVNDAFGSESLQWLPYDIDSQKWSLYRVKPRVVSDVGIH
jgi:hypothetical protein